MEPRCEKRAQNVRSHVDNQVERVFFVLHIDHFLSSAASVLHERE
jgi:hypothetical protein